MSKGQESSNNTDIPTELKSLEDELVAKNPEIFKGLNQEKKIELLRSFSFTLIHEKTHSGPLPDVETLRQYNSIIPNGADRIMIMAEKQQEHRMRMESNVIKSQSTQSAVGQFLGFLIGVVGICSGTFLAYSGETVVGSIIAGGTVISLVSVFVIGKNIQNKKQ